jgi:hypothetical protein
LVILPFNGFTSRQKMAPVKGPFSVSPSNGDA